MDKKVTRGLTLVEVLIASSIILVFVVALVTVHNTYLGLASSTLRATKAAYLAEEGIEATKFLRDTSWSTNIATLSNGTTYYLAFGSGRWSLSTTTNIIDSSYQRSIVFSAVSRDSFGRIVTSGGTVDNNTRMLTSTVSWSGSKATTTKSVSTYISNIFNN